MVVVIRPPRTNREVQMAHPRPSPTDHPTDRLLGEFLLARSWEHHDEAETSFRQALKGSRRQQAKSFGLRAVLSLGRLWQRQGKRDTVRQQLAEVYGWFTEGFNTVDLQEAKALLGHL